MYSRCDEVWVRLRDRVGSSSGGLAARSAVPDTDSSALDGVLSAELAHVAGVLCDLKSIVSTRASQSESHVGVRTSIFLTCLRSEAP
jgi:hypothetical protein